MTKYSPKLCSNLQDMFKNGEAIVEVCQKLKITRETYFKWKKLHKEWDAATQFAEETSEAFYCKQGRLALFSNGKYKMDTGLYAFIMKTRFKYRETDDKNTPDGATNGQPMTITFQVAPAVGEVIVTNAASET